MSVNGFWNAYLGSILSDPICRKGSCSISCGFFGLIEVGGFVGYTLVCRALPQSLHEEEEVPEWPPLQLLGSSLTLLLQYIPLVLWYNSSIIHLVYKYHYKWYGAMLRNVEESYRVCLWTMKQGFDSCIVNFCFLIFVFEIAWEMLQCLSLLSHISFSFCISFLVYEWPSWPNFLIKLTDACCVWNCCPWKILWSFLWHSVIH